MSDLNEKNKGKTRKPRIKWETWEEDYLVKLIERNYPNLGKLHARIIFKSPPPLQKKKKGSR